MEEIKATRMQRVLHSSFISHLGLLGFSSLQGVGQGPSCIEVRCTCQDDLICQLQVASKSEAALRHAYRMLSRFLKEALRCHTHRMLLHS